MLDIKGLRKSFGGLTAVNDIYLRVSKGETVGLIGPNGSGKTTTINLIAGAISPDKGSIIFKGDEIARLEPHQICKKGVCRTFQLVNIFLQMTVLQNVIVASLFGREKVSFKEAEEKAYEFLKFVELDKYASQYAENLTYVNQKRLEFARALATKPDLVLLDEFFAGLNASELSEAIMIVEKAKTQGISFIIVEHIMSVIVKLCERVVALNAGEKICEGKPDVVMENEELIISYLGDTYAKC